MAQSQWVQRPCYKLVEGIWRIKSSDQCLALKLKALKTDLTVWNKEAYANITIRKAEALSLIGFWDSKDRVSPLSTEEVETRRVAFEQFTKRLQWKKLRGNKKTREIWLKMEIRILSFSTKWPMRSGREVCWPKCKLMMLVYQKRATLRMGCLELPTLFFFSTRRLQSKHWGIEFWGFGELQFQELGGTFIKESF